MANSVFMKAEEVQEMLGVSRSESYRIIKKLNDDLKAKGFIVLSGRVSRKYLEEMIYGYPSVPTPNKEAQYDITKHPNYKYLSDASDKNYFDIEKYLSTHLKTKPEDVYEVFEVDASDEVATD